MSENFDNEKNSAEKKADVPPVTNPSSYKPPVYNSGQYSSSNQYMPYGSYYQQPEAEKSPSKNKKKGFITALIIILAVFLIAAAVIVGSFIYKAFKSDVPTTPGGDGTQLELRETPNDTDERPDDGRLTSNEVNKKVCESSVGILVYTSRQQQVYSEGTGVIMGTNADNTATYIITCAHVIDAPTPTIIVQTNDGTQYDGIIVGMDSKTDIGVLRINATGLKAAEFADSSKVAVGDWVYAIGNPGGIQLFGSFTNGMVSAIGRPVKSPVGYEVPCIQHTAAISPGNSGGALVNEYGQVIGINSSKIASADYESIGFSIPSETVKEIVDEIIKHGRVTNRPILGIKYLSVASNQTYSIIAKSNNLPVGTVIIDSITVNSDLRNSDVKAGDMIIAVNGKDLENTDMLMDVIENSKVGDSLTLTICRIDDQYHITKFDVTAKLVEDTGDTVQKEEAPTQKFPFPFGE